jgi:isopentenyldiphosphate isomerase
MRNKNAMLEISILWLVNKERELLLQKRSLTKIFHPGEWGPTVAGTAENNETPTQTLAREVEEELGLKPDDYKAEFLLTKDFNHADGRVRRFSIYFAPVPKDIVEKFIIDQEEVADVKWLPLSKIKEMLVAPSKEFKLVPSAKEVWPETFEMLEKKW